MCNEIWDRCACMHNPFSKPTPKLAPVALSAEMLGEEDRKMLDVLRMNLRDPNMVRDGDERQDVFAAIRWADRLLNQGESDGKE